ncbi:hypothetical protein ACU4X8_005249 [Escherichia coli]
MSGNTGIVPEMDDAVEGLGYGNKRKRKLTAVCSHQTRIGNLDAHLI